MFASRNLKKYADYASTDTFIKRAIIMLLVPNFAKSYVSAI